MGWPALVCCDGSWVGRVQHAERIRYESITCTLVGDSRGVWFTFK